MKNACYRLVNSQVMHYGLATSVQSAESCMGENTKTFKDLSTIVQLKPKGLSRTAAAQNIPMQNETCFRSNASSETMQ